MIFYLFFHEFQNERKNTARKIGVWTNFKTFLKQVSPRISVCETTKESFTSFFPSIFISII